jgi:hypothetical protein
MRELLVVKTTPVYGASKTSASVNTATSPEMLAEGAIGIYYVKKSTGAPTLLLSTATDLSTAITDTDLPAAKIPFIYAIGTATSVEITDNVPAENIISLIGKEFAAGVKQGWYIGYNGTTGDLVIPTIATYDEAGIDVTVRRMGTNVEDDHALYNASLTLGDSKFNVASKICDAVNVATLNPKVLAEVNSNLVGSAIAAGTSIAFVKGSNSATVVGTFTSLATDDYLQLGMIPSANVIGAAPTAGNVATYKVLLLSGGVITLDRAYSGETQTVSAAGSSIVIDNTTVTGNGVFAHVTRTGTAPTSVGVRVTSLDALSAIDISTYGVIAPATLRTAGNTQSLGSGTPFLMKRLEDNMFIEAGNYQTLDATVPKAVSKLVTTAGYDLYQMTYKKGTGLDARVIANDVYFAFEQGAAGANGSGTVFLALISLIGGLTATPIAQVVTPLKGTVTANG